MSTGLLPEQYCCCDKLMSLQELIRSSLSIFCAGDSESVVTECVIFLLFTFSFLTVYASEAVKRFRRTEFVATL